MLPKEQRLDTKGVALVFEQKRKTARTPYFNVMYTNVPGLLCKKYAVIVSKKNFSRAVDRNKARRRVYNSIQKMSIAPTPPLAIVVQCNKESVDLDSKTFFTELEKAFRQSII
jgi:ribonuclease P protein component